MNNTTQPTPGNNREGYVLLLDGSSVSKGFFDKIFKQVEGVMAAMKRDKHYTLKEICGDRFWRRLGTGDQIMAGKCMALIVTEMKLPFVFQGKNSANALLYKLA